MNTHVKTELPRLAHEVETAYAWWRLAVAVLLSTIGGVGMWSYMVALPAVQAEFGLSRAPTPRCRTPGRCSASGSAASSMGRFADRFGIMLPVMAARSCSALGYLAIWARAKPTGSIAIAHGVLIGLGCSATFAPLVADISLVVHAPARHRGGAMRLRQLLRRRGLAADRAALHRDRRLARRRISASASSASSPWCRWRWCCAAAPLCTTRGAAAPRPDASRRHARPQARHAAGLLAVAGVALLCRHVDAAGAHRRLLRRARLRRGARRRDAVADARLRRHQPRRLGLLRRPHRRPRDAAARLGAAGRRALLSTSPSTG